MAGQSSKQLSLGLTSEAEESALAGAPDTGATPAQSESVRRRRRLQPESSATPPPAEGRHPRAGFAYDETAPAALVSAFEVEFDLGGIPEQVTVDTDGKVVEGHLRVFTAMGSGGVVPASTRIYDALQLHQAAVSEHAQIRGVGRQAECVLEHAAVLGVQADRSRRAIASDLHVSRSRISRAAAVRSLRERYPDLALSKSHFEAVLSVDEPERGRFLLEATEHGLSVRDMEQLIATAHPERRRQRRGDEILADLLERSGVADLLGEQWERDRRGCVSAIRRLFRVTAQFAPHLLGVPRGTAD